MKAITMRSDKIIKAEIAALQACKRFVPCRNFFGDDNHETIDAEIRVLQDRLNTDTKIAAVFLIGGDAGEDTPDIERAYELESAAREAMHWMTGKTNESPSAGWAHLKKDAK